MFLANEKGTNKAFNNFNSANEQALVEALSIEAIKQKGKDMVYLPFRMTNYDSLRGEDDQLVYDKAFPIELYIKDVNGFGGDGYLFNLQGSQDFKSIVLTVSKKIWEQEIGVPMNQARPNEKDLIYFPLEKKLFSIKFTDYKPFMYQLGDLPVYDLTVSLIEYSNQTINTGIPEIDILQKKWSTNILDRASVDNEGDLLVSEEGSVIPDQEYFDNPVQDSTEDNTEIIKETKDRELIKWEDPDPFSLKGEF